MFLLPYTSNIYPPVNFLGRAKRTERSGPSEAGQVGRGTMTAHKSPIYSTKTFQMSGKHRLFYSTRCRHCQAFMQELARTSYASEFILVCVDPSPSRPPLPPWLKSVPTMIPAGSSEPLVGPGAVNNWLAARKMGVDERKSGSAALEERSMPIRPPDYTPELAPRPNATARTPTSAISATAAHIVAAVRGSDVTASSASSGSSSGKPDLLGVKAYEGTDANVLAYHGNEMSGSGKWSDSYSFIGASDGSSDKMFNPIGRQFESLVSGGAAPGVGAAAGGGGGGSRPQRSVKEDAQNARLEAFMAARDSDVPGPLARR